MDPYLIYGVVRPERAQISLEFGLTFHHLATQRNADAKVSIILNQVAVWVFTEDDWNVSDLRNVVLGLLRNQLSIIGYIKGYAYEIELTRIVSLGRGVDYVYGVEIPCIAARNQTLNLEDEFQRIRELQIGSHGIYLHRAFCDLNSAMRDADDTGFYCYRAIESLRNHCSAVRGISGPDKSTHWVKFREVSDCDEPTLRKLKLAADPVRHGHPMIQNDVDRVSLFLETWKVVDSYLNNIQTTFPAT
jgi:hypothetical protein